MKENKMRMYEDSSFNKKERERETVCDDCNQLEID